MEIIAAKRVKGVKPYFFADLAKTIAELKHDGMDIIRLDMGSPDLPPEDFIIEALVTAARQPDQHGYGQSGGSVSLKTAVAEFYLRRFGVSLNPNQEVLGLIGSKEGLFNLSQVLVNPGDLVLMPDPCYPVYAVGALITQAETYSMPLVAANNFLPNFSLIPQNIAQKAKLMWLNYPNNPTGAIAPLDFFKRAIEFAAQNNIIIAHDAPYVDVCFDGYQAPSILQIEGAKNVAVEFSSLSKTFNMAGWRVGFVCGNPEVVKLLQVYKSQLDSSHFKPIMYAAEIALLGDQSWVNLRNAIYQQRRDIIINTLFDLGFSLEPPKASLYVWARLPEKWLDSVAFCETLLNKTGVSITPGSLYGDSGAGYIRISLVTPEDRLEEAMQRMIGWMKE